MAAKSKKSVKTPKVKVQKRNISTTSKPVDREAPIMRLRKLTRRQNKKRKHEAANKKKLPSAWSILKRSLLHLYTHKGLFLGILAVYAILNIMFVKGISGSLQLSTLRQQLSDTFGGQLGKLGTGVTLFGLLVGSFASTPSEVAGAYQTLLIIIMSLALIWALRQTYDNTLRVRVKDAFYHGMYPLVPLFIVLFFILLQLIPFAVTSSVYATAQGNGLIASGAENIIWLTVFGLGVAASLYFLSSSLFAFYIVTLPDGKPRAALKQARQLVRYRRLIIIRKLLFLPAILILFAAATLIPLIILFPPAAEALFFLLTIVVLAVFHSYIYTLYRELL